MWHLNVYVYRSELTYLVVETDDFECYTQKVVATEHDLMCSNLDLNNRVGGEERMRLEALDVLQTAVKN